MSRYLDAVIPMVAVAGAYGLVWIGAHLGRAPRGTLAAVVTVAAVPGLIDSVQSVRFFDATDTRTLAREFIDRTVPAGASLLVQPYSAPVFRSRESLVEALRANLGSETRASTKYQIELSLPPADPSYRTIYLGDGGTDADKLYVLPREFESHTGLAPLRKRGIQYAVLKRANLPNLELAALQAALDREGDLLATFSPYHDGIAAGPDAPPPYLHNTAIRIEPELERPGPIVDVWRIP
jgi:hypothetical protein